MLRNARWNWQNPLVQASSNLLAKCKIVHHNEVSANAVNTLLPSAPVHQSTTALKLTDLLSMNQNIVPGCILYLMLWYYHTYHIIYNPYVYIYYVIHKSSNMEIAKHVLVSLVRWHAQKSVPNFKAFHSFYIFFLSDWKRTEAKPPGSTATGERKHRRGRAGGQPRNGVHSHTVTPCNTFLASEISIQILG